MSDGVFNIARGRIRSYCELPAAADAILAVLLQSTGLQTDDTLRDHATFAAVLAANTEATFTNYARKVITTLPTLTINNTTNVLDADTADLTWTAAGGVGLTNNSLSKLLFVYRPDTASATSAMIPMTYHDYLFYDTGTGTLVPVTTDGSAMLAMIALTGFYRSQ